MPTNSQPVGNDFSPLGFVVEFGFLMIDLEITELIGNNKEIELLYEKIYTEVFDKARKVISKNPDWDYSNFLRVYPEAIGIIGNVEDYLDANSKKVDESPEIESRYAESIIKGNLTDYDAVELHGVRNLNAPDSEDGTHFVIDDEEPELYSVYLHCREGGVECVGDFSKLDKSIEYAEELSVKYNWKLSSFAEAS